MVSPTDWNVNSDQAEQHTLKIALSKPVGSIVIEFEAPSTGSTPLLELRWLAKGGVISSIFQSTFKSGSTHFSVAAVQAPAGGEFTIHSAAVPTRLVWRITPLTKTLVDWERTIIPRAMTEFEGSNALSPLIGRIADLLDRGEVAEACAEIAMSTLVDADTISMDGARYMFQQLARRPFLRTPELGALVCSLTTLSKQQ